MFVVDAEYRCTYFLTENAVTKPFSCRKQKRNEKGLFKVGDGVFFKQREWEQSSSLQFRNILNKQNIQRKKIEIRGI